MTAGRTREWGVFDARVTTTAGEGVLPTRTAVGVTLDRLSRSSEEPIVGDQAAIVDLAKSVLCDVSLLLRTRRWAGGPR